MQDFYDKNKKMFESPERVRARHILIAVDEDDTADVKADKKKKAQDVRRQLAEKMLILPNLPRPIPLAPARRRGFGLFGRESDGAAV